MSPSYHTIMKTSSSIFFRIMASSALFYGLLLLNLVWIGSIRFFPSMDGPAHLHNACLLRAMLSGNAEILRYFQINSFVIPNWLSHALLVGIGYLAPAWLAEKILILGYIAGMALSFRFLVRQANPQHPVAALLVFPMIYTFLFHLGFYNFSLAFIGYFVALALFFKQGAKGGWAYHLALLILFLLTYYANILIFAFLGFTLGVAILFQSCSRPIQWKEQTLLAAKRLLLLFLAALPGLILALLFYTRTAFFSSGQPPQAANLLKLLNDGRPFIVFSYIPEEGITSQYVHILLVLLVCSFLRGNQFFGKEGNNKKTVFLFLPAALALILLFVVPDSSGAGMMTDRFGVMVFLFGTVWLASRLQSGRLTSTLVLILLLLHLGLLIRHVNGPMRSLNNQACQLVGISDSIAPNSTVLPVNLSDNWLQTHFSNYIGIDKPLIILENYEASVGWFPVSTGQS